LLDSLLTSNYNVHLILSEKGQGKRKN